MTHISLFSGVGGIDLAAHWAGFQTIQFVERDPFCQRVLDKNFKGVPIHDDIITFDGRPFAGRTDLVSAGFPCQPHSLAGKRLASGDERDLWGEVVRVLGETQPRWFLGENVPGLLSSESGRFFGRVVDDLAALGFSVGWCVYGACDVGAVHRRNRVFIVAYSSGAGLEGQGQRGSVANCVATDTNSFGRHDGINNRRKRSVQAASIGCAQEDKPERDGRELRACQDVVDATDSAHLLGNGGNDQPERRVSEPRNRHHSTDWRSWGIEPVVCRSNDDVSRRVDVARLKALGNAVVPQQAYPILKAIAEASR